MSKDCYCRLATVLTLNFGKSNMHVREDARNRRHHARVHQAAAWSSVYDYIGGVDFQGTPHHAAVICKIYGTLDAPMVFVVDEFVAENSTEDELLDQIDEAGYQPESLLWVGDASGQWQDGKHSGNGRDSFKVFTSRRWRIVPPAEKRATRAHGRKTRPSKSASVDQQALQTTGCECRHGWQSLAKRCAMSLGKGTLWRQTDGLYSHITDAMGYVCWWVFLSEAGHHERRRYRIYLEKREPRMSMAKKHALRPHSIEIGTSAHGRTRSAFAVRAGGGAQEKPKADWRAVVERVQRDAAKPSSADHQRAVVALGALRAMGELRDRRRAKKAHEGIRRALVGSKRTGSHRPQNCRRDRLAHRRGHTASD